MQKIPCCFSPTKVLVIDDDPKFLSQLRLVLDREKNIFEYHEAPKNALKIVNDSSSEHSLLEN